MYWASGAITRIVDGVMAPTSADRPPDWQAPRSRPRLRSRLADVNWQRRRGLPWRSWANDPACYCDAGPPLHHRPALPPSPSASRWSTARPRAMLADSRSHKLPAAPPTPPPCSSSTATASPTRTHLDTRTLRAGVEIDEYGAPTAIHPPGAPATGSTPATRWSGIKRSPARPNLPPGSSCTTTPTAPRRASRRRRHPPPGPDLRLCSRFDLVRRRRAPGRRRRHLQRLH